jgi:GTP pyrophosphokinase
MEDLETALRQITMAPYIVKATALIGIKRKAGSNMFRHQISTFGILLDYKITDSVLLKASVIHDLFEDAPQMPGVSEAEIKRLDSDGTAVYDLVMEVTIRTIDGKREPKSEYLLRVIRDGSPRAKILKLADRISNIYALGFVSKPEFIRRYLQETKDYILPHAEKISPDMFRELSDLVENRELMLHLLEKEGFFSRIWNGLRKKG